MATARWMIAGGAVLAALGVLAGAFGAHALRGRLAPEMLEVFRTGVHYHLVHAVALVLAGVLALQLPGTGLLRGAGTAFGLGILLFSGSLYLLALTGVRGLGAVTPLGGLAFVAGWVLLACGAWRG